MNEQSLRDMTMMARAEARKRSWADGTRFGRFSGHQIRGIESFESKSPVPGVDDPLAAYWRIYAHWAGESVELVWYGPEEEVTATLDHLKATYPRDLSERQEERER